MSDNEEDLYDEFGNYIGPDLESSSEEEDESGDEEDASDVSDDEDDDEEEDDEEGVNADGGDGAVVVRDDNDVNEEEELAEPMSAVVLHEDKEHYESAEQVYGEGVRTVVLDEDAMDLDVPLVEPVSTKSHLVSSTTTTDVIEDDWMYTEDYLTTVLLSNETTRTRRSIAIVGHLHHGKTSLIDFLLEQTLRSQSWGPRASLDVNQGGGPRYTDIYKSEQDRHMSLVSTPISTLLPDTRGKTFCFTMMDCPGHPNFHDESVASLRAVDGAVVVVDAVEGIMMHTEMVLKQSIAEGLPILLVISKMDRLIVELKLPPRDCYFKLLDIIDRVNNCIAEYSFGRYPKLCPSRGNVAFASSQHGWLFTVQSFAQVYLEHHDTNHDDGTYGLGNNLSVQDFAKRLWGDAYLDPTTRTFHKSPPAKGVHRTFITFILEPIYKIYTACLGERETDVNKLLRGIGVLLNRDQLRSSARPLLRIALSTFLQTANCGFVDMIAQHVPSPAAAAKGKIARHYTGPLHTKSAKAMLNCDPQGPLIIHCVKMYASSDGLSFSTLGRIYSGTIRPGEQVRVLGEGYSPEDDEDMAIATVDAVAIPRGRHRTNVTIAKAGNLILLDGVDGNIGKTATIVKQTNERNIYDTNNNNNDDDDDIHIFAPLKFLFAGGESVMKLAIEPLNPAELPKMVEGLRRISKAYPMVKTRVEESGEHVLLGTGELYLDCVMHDLRHVYSDIEVKVADPVVSFRETVIETSSIKCHAEATNKRNKLTFIAEPLDEGLAEKLEAGKVDPNWDTRKLGRFFQTKYDWDLLSSRSVWAFGDSPIFGTNILLDDTLPSEIDKDLLHTCKSSIIQGFQWATREGPLCEEPVRGTKLKILEATLADKPIHRGGGQMIPTARKVVHSSLVTASPRLMEPIYRVQIQCPSDVAIVNAIEPVLTRRRGHLIVRDKPVPGTMLTTLSGFLPVLDSFGFETDLRTYTQGQAMVTSIFDHWSVVPGDPLDRNIILHPLEPSPTMYLARELLLKTRRRKGLSEDVILTKFFDSNDGLGILNNK